MIDVLAEPLMGLIMASLMVGLVTWAAYGLSLLADAVFDITEKPKPLPQTVICQAKLIWSGCAKNSYGTYDTYTCWDCHKYGVVSSKDPDVFARSKDICMLGLYPLNTRYHVQIHEE